MARQLIDLTGKRFGSWLVMRRYNEDYGKCDFANGYHNHRSDSCDKFERRGE